MPEYISGPISGIRHIGRYREIISILVKYGFSEFFSMLELEKHIASVGRAFRGKRGEAEFVEKYSTWQRIRLALEELGPTFIKLGQILSSRSDLLPAAFIEELENLQDSVPPFEFEQAKEIVESELKRPLEEVFDLFDEEVVASASIAQVYKAQLKTGEEVAVKVMRPNIEDQVQLDVEIMLHLASLAEKYNPQIALLNPVSIIKRFKASIMKEVNFKKELTNIIRFDANFGDAPYIYVPKVYPHISTKHILVLEYIGGEKLSKVADNNLEGYDKKLIALRGADSILRQIFLHGFFHADPHPGNIKILEGNIICFLDFGMMGRITPSQREKLGDILVSISKRDSSRIAKVLLSMSENTEHVVSEDFEGEIFEILDQYVEVPLETIDISKLLQDILDIVINHRIMLPASLTMMMKALISIEGTGRKLDPTFQVMPLVKPIAEKLMSDAFDPKNIFTDLYFMASDYEKLAKEIPQNVRDIIRLLKTGRMQIEFRHLGIEPIVKRLDRISYRLVFGIILAAMLISSSLIAHAAIGPQVFGFPVLGVVGFVFSAILGFFVIFSIFISMRQKD